MKNKDKKKRQVLLRFVAVHLTSVKSHANEFMLTAYTRAEVIKNIHFFAYIVYVFQSLLVETIPNAFGERSLNAVKMRTKINQSDALNANDESSHKYLNSPDYTHGPP